MAYYKPLQEQLAMKIQNNVACPCRSNKKYKHCCKGKQLFFKNEADKQRAEYYILERQKNGADQKS